MALTWTARPSVVSEGNRGSLWSMAVACGIGLLAAAELNLALPATASIVLVPMTGLCLLAFVVSHARRFDAIEFSALGFACMAFLSANWAYDPTFTASSAQRVAIAMLGLVAVRQLSSARDQRIVLGFLVAGGAVLTLRMIFLGAPFQKFTAITVAGANPNQVGYYLVAACAAAIMAVPLVRSALKIPVALLAAAAGLTTIPTQCRGAQASALLALALVLVIRWRSDHWAFRWLWVIVGAGLLWLSLPVIRTLLDQNPLDAAGSAQLWTTGRSGVWQQALDLASLNPMLGVGWDNFQIVSFPHIYPHNFFLQAAVELGVIGLAMTLILVVSLGWVSLRRSLLAGLPFLVWLPISLTGVIFGALGWWVLLGLMTRIDTAAKVSIREGEFAGAVEPSAAGPLGTRFVPDANRIFDR